MYAQLTRAGGNCFLVVSRSVVGRDDLCVDGQDQSKQMGEAGVRGFELAGARNKRHSLHSSSRVHVKEKNLAPSLVSGIRLGTERGAG